jgi:hypothetical protein
MARTMDLHWVHLRLLAVLMPRRLNASAAVCVERCAVSAMTPRTASARAVLAPCALQRCADKSLDAAGT